MRRWVDIIWVGLMLAWIIGGFGTLLFYAYQTGALPRLGLGFLVIFALWFALEYRRILNRP